MPSQKAPRNKTIELSESEIEALTKNLITLQTISAPQDIINHTIWQDAFEALDYLPDSFVDLLIVDPPYNMDKVFGAGSFKKMHLEAYEYWTDQWLAKVLPKLKRTASLYVCSDWQSSTAIFRVLSRYCRIQNRITWEREKGRGAKTNWKNASEDIWFATMSDDYYFDVEAVKLRRRVIAPYRDATGSPKDWEEGRDGNFRLTHPSNLWTDITVPFWSMPENTSHPTQKPEKLLAKIILASSREGEIVLDPFLGSGTTSVVAKKLGRRYVGIEIDQHFACLAQKRLIMADHNTRIQGYSDGVFWERNAQFDAEPRDTAPVQRQQRKLF